MEINNGNLADKSDVEEMANQYLLELYDGMRLTDEHSEKLHQLYKKIYIQGATDQEKLMQGENWTRVCDLMPPFDKRILLRGVMTWRSKNRVSYFSDVVKNDYEQLDYGQCGYFLENNSDYLVINHHDREELSSDFITHWKYLNEPED